MDDTLKDIKDKLDSVSPSFCLAKWMQVTLHLQNGHTHSCHHPSTHKIPLEEIKNNPAALHNTRFKEEQRKKMLVGERPKECEYCWNLEDSGSLSDRHYKSSFAWGREYFETVRDGKYNGNPSYVEVCFDSTCNFKCAYCTPAVSSSWMEEIKQYGPYPTSDRFGNLEWLQKEQKIPIPQREHNPYIEAFWKWWPDLINDLRIFRITGGEPLLSKNTWKVLDYLIENPHPNLILEINTNLGVPEELIDKFIDKLKKLEEIGKPVKIYTSIDTLGDHAEYIRYGLDYERFMKVISRLLKETNSILAYMITVNALSLVNFIDLFELLYKQKQEFPGRILPDTPYLRFPGHLSLQILTDDYTNYLEETIAFVKPRIDPGGVHKFDARDLDRLERILKWMKSPKREQDIRILRRDFYSFIVEYDKRRGTDFLKTFPEMEDFYNLCRRIYEEDVKDG